MSSPEEPGHPDARAVRVRQLIWAGGTVVALWFIADGLSGLWSGAAVLARLLIVVFAALVVLGVVIGVMSVVRRDRQD